MTTWRSEHTYELCVFRSCRDYRMTGRKHTTNTTTTEEFAITDSEYADDTAMPFCTRKDVGAVLNHFKRWGMEVHAGVVEPRKESKSEILFCAKPPSMYTDYLTFDGADLSDVLLPGGLFMNIVFDFKYLGSYISHNGSDAKDVDSRLVRRLVP